MTHLTIACLGLPKCGKTSLITLIQSYSRLYPFIVYQKEHVTMTCFESSKPSELSLELLKNRSLYSVDIGMIVHSIVDNNDIAHLFVCLRSINIKKLIIVFSFMDKVNWDMSVFKKKMDVFLRMYNLRTIFYSIKSIEFIPVAKDTNILINHPFFYEEKTHKGLIQERAINKTCVYDEVLKPFVYKVYTPLTLMAPEDSCIVCIINCPSNVTICQFLKCEMMCKNDESDRMITIPCIIERIVNKMTGMDVLYVPKATIDNVYYTLHFKISSKYSVYEHVFFIEPKSKEIFAIGVIF